MKDTQKYSTYIYIMIPVLVAIWPALVLAIYLPGAREKLQDDISTYADANNTMLDILSLSPERIESEDPNKEKIEFSYDRVIDEVASACDIDEGNYDLVVIGAHQKGGWQDLLLDDLAQQIIARLDRPVLVMR